MPLKNSGFNAITYGIDTDEADVFGTNLRFSNGSFFMDVHFSNVIWKRVELGLPGIHNAENALAVIGLCVSIGLSEPEIRSGLKEFKGVKRRFEFHIRTSKLVYIDDYAHHPTEIAALVASVRLLYPNHKITGVFQPHLFSRTRDFISGFSAELSKLDEAIVLPIYPARETPIDGVTSDVMVKSMSNLVSLKSPEQVLEWAKNQREGIILTIGAGDIDRIVPELTNIFKAIALKHE